MKIIGVTGGIGSGKSAVSSILVGLGAAAVDADDIAHRIVEKEQPALSELAAFFGNEILNRDGSLNRKRLAELTFGDNAKVSMLNQITHTYIAQEIHRQVQEYRQNGQYPCVVLDVPIPVEYGFRDLADEIWVVAAERENRILRVMERSGLNREQTEKRMAVQASQDEYIRIADVVIYNDGTPEDLEQSVKELYMGRICGKAEHGKT